MNSFTYLFRKIRKRFPLLLLMTAANVGSAIFGVVFALGTRGIINSAVSGNVESLMHAVVVQALIILGILVCTTLFRYLNNELAAVLDRDWKRHLLHSILRSNYADISQVHSGELLNRLNNDVRTVNDGILSAIPSFAAMVTRLIAVVVIMAAMEPWLLAVMAVIGLAVILATGAARKRLQDLNKRVSAADGKVSGFLQEILEKLLLVQATDVGQEVERRADDLMEQRYVLQCTRRRITVLSNTCITVMMRLSSFAALIWSAFGVFHGTMTFGDLTALTQLVSQLQGPFVNLSGVLPKYIAMLASCERLMELEQMCLSAEHSPKQDPWKLYHEMTGICAQNLSFSYGRDMVLHESSFRLPKGAFAAIVGPSGVGKSTLLRLMLGIYRPGTGAISAELPSDSVPFGSGTRGLFAYVPQGNLLFSGTLRENLTLVKPDATEEEIQQAVRLSCMDLYLPQLPDGLETVLGENAHGLSEGQAQRLAIARAVLGGAPILLLDEVTSALDAETEQMVLQRLRELPDRTCITVTHRPAALELADWQLKVDENGVCCERIRNNHE